MLAHSLVSLMPPLAAVDQRIQAQLQSILNGGLEFRNATDQIPFRKPHHTITVQAMVGGGQWPIPGEVSLAHGGVLFLDELPEFRREVLEALREPLEQGQVVLNRQRSSAVYPAKFVLIAAMNPCPCGYYGSNDERCTCAETTVTRYQRRISGPFWIVWIWWSAWIGSNLRNGNQPQCRSSLMELCPDRLRETARKFSRMIKLWNNHWIPPAGRSWTKWWSRED